MVTEELEAAHDYRREREDAPCGEAKLEGKKATRLAEDRAGDEPGERRRERVNDSLGDPAPTRLVPIPVGTRDPVDRVGSSGERLLDDRRRRRGEREQREDPTRTPEAPRERPDEGAGPGEGNQHPEQRRLRQHTVPTKPRHMQRYPPLLIQSQHEYTLQPIRILQQWFPPHE